MTANPDTKLKSPSLKKLTGESRAWVEWAKARLSNTDTQGCPTGDGQPIMIIPGFGAGDSSTALFCKKLNALKFNAMGWGQGRNLGMSGELKTSLSEKMAQINDETGQSVHLVGWSLGGIFAREVARHHPRQVAQVFTLGSPFNITPNANNMLPLFRITNMGRPVNLDWEGFTRRVTPPPQPCTAIYSKSDGIVAWQSAMEDEHPNTENIEVTGSHFGMIYNPDVLRIIATKVAAY